MFFKNQFDHFMTVISYVGWIDLIDVFLVSFILYRILMVTKNTGATQIFFGLIVLSGAYGLSIYFDLVTFNWILNKFFSNLILIMIILFQSEIRRALAQLGKNPFQRVGLNIFEGTHAIDELSKGIIQMEQKGYGGLIVIEREMSLDYFMELGVEINADIKADFLVSVFQPFSPMHDGAAIIRNGRITHVCCLLPLSKNPLLDKKKGTRHRAAIGLTEETDAIVVLISEENRSISLIYKGNILSDLDYTDLRLKLYKIFTSKKFDDQEFFESA